MMRKTPDELRSEFWKQDLLCGGTIFYQYLEVKDVLMRADIDSVEARLNLLKRHAIEQTDFYSRYSISDDFPVTNKISILENYEAHKARGGFEQPIHIAFTSGSTGTPFSVLQDYKKRMRTIADLKVFGEMGDYPSHECMVFFRALSEKLYRSAEQEDRENIYYVDSCDLSDKGLEKMVQILLEKEPRTVLSYPSTLIVLAKFIEQNKIRSADFSMSSVLTIGEGLSAGDRTLLEHAFNCRVYRRYSNNELGILAQDRGSGSAYILNYGSYYFECLKQDSNEPTRPGELGRIIITDLHNYAFPMIRYDTGDLGVMESSTNGRVSIFKEIYGRATDCVYATNGRLISPQKLYAIMWGAEGVNQWQFIQEAENEYWLRLNGDSSMNAKLLVSKIKGVIGKDAHVTVELVNEIPVLSSSKRRAVMCNYIKRK